MARGFVWAVYVDDTGNQWALRVDQDYAEDPDRGWFQDGVDQLAPLPRSYRPRYVVGIDESGRTQRAIAGNLSAAIWAGTVGLFVFRTTDGFEAAADIIGRRGEYRPRIVAGGP